MLPFKSKRILVKIDDEVVGVVEGMASQFIREGGVEPNFMENEGEHTVGQEHFTFSIRRWLFIDPNKETLLFDLWNYKTKFTLTFGINEEEGELDDYSEGKRLELQNCMGYRWRPITGTANDIVAEELVGEATIGVWEDAPPSCPCTLGEEVMVNGDFETGDFTGWSTVGGATISTSGEYEGTYCAELALNASITQTLPAGMSYNCISAWTLWIRYRELACFGSASYQITITYSDASTTTISSSGPFSWTQIDLRAALDTGKIVSSIKVECTAASDAAIQVDLVQLTCGE